MGIMLYNVAKKRMEGMEEWNGILRHNGNTTARK
jgi:hypothetical protein